MWGATGHASWDLFVAHAFAMCDAAGLTDDSNAGASGIPAAEDDELSFTTVDAAAENTPAPPLN